MYNLNLYNTLQKKTSVFNPIDKNNVRMYACGPTVYDFIHIGNARPLVVFDVLVRLLRTMYNKVTYVRNITDIDDKINKRAIEKNIKILSDEGLKIHPNSLKEFQRKNSRKTLFEKLIFCFLLFSLAGWFYFIYAIL